MSWLDNHNKSVEHASLAESMLRANDIENAHNHYREAAKCELLAFQETDVQKTRTKGITLISAVSLFYKARDFDDAENLAFANIGTPELPDFAKLQLKDLIQSIWNEKEFANTNVGFTEGEVLVSVSGGDVVTGGAPLDLILSKVNDIKSYFYRTIEMMLDKPLRTRGAPERYIQEQCRPWLFQAPAGSYQFAVRVQKPRQQELFGDDLPKIQHITDKFIQIVDAASRDDVEDLEYAVPKEEYRKVFLKMTRNLAPTGKTYAKLEIRPSQPASIDSVVLVPDSRSSMNQLIKNISMPTEDPIAEEPDRLIGTLRALHLAKDWIEVTIDNRGDEEHIKVTKTGEVIDDLVGPMVTRRVVVDAIRSSDGSYRFQDIEIDE